MDNYSNALDVISMAIEKAKDDVIEAKREYKDCIKDGPNKNFLRRQLLTDKGKLEGLEIALRII